MDIPASVLARPTRWVPRVGGGRGFSSSAQSAPANRLASNHIRPLHRHQQSGTSSVSEAPSQGANTHHPESELPRDDDAPFMNRFRGPADIKDLRPD